MMSTLSPRLLRVAVGILLAAAGMAAPRLEAAPGALVAFPNSIREVPTTAAAAAKAPHHARVSRTTLRGDERAASLTFEVALRMRNFADNPGSATSGMGWFCKANRTSKIGL